MANWGKILSRGNVEDRRSFSPMIGGGLSITAIALYFLITVLTDGQVNIPVEQLEQLTPKNTTSREVEEFAGEDSYEIFASTVLGSNNDMWNEVFANSRITYNPPRLVLFRTATESACGVATSQVGPHYCPIDSTIYLDETFFDELVRRFGAEGGDVAEAYVISHEVAHHVQSEFGILSSVDEEIRKNSSLTNDLNIKLELQADCFAGLWAYYISDLDVLNPGEIGEAMDAAAAVGDDRIQEKVQGRVSPENWTHGSSEQRVMWFTKGYEGKNVAVCDTFNE